MLRILLTARLSGVTLVILMLATAVTLAACGGADESAAPAPASDSETTEAASGEAGEGEASSTDDPSAEGDSGEESDDSGDESADPTEGSGEPEAEEPVSEESGDGDASEEDAESEEGDAAAESDEPEEAAVPSGSFTGVRGVATLDGERPRRKAVRMDADPGCAEIHGDRKVGTDNALVTKEGQILNVFVYVKNGASLGEVPVPTTAEKLDQVGCMYTPHVIGVRAKQPLDIVNSDPLAHNIHGLCEVNREFNFGQPTPGTRQHVFRKPEMAMTIKCDIHPWMKAYVFSMDHPYFAITDETGSYAIPDLPAGTHTLVAWHETFGEKETQVTVGADGGATANFTFTP